MKRHEEEERKILGMKTFEFDSSTKTRPNLWCQSGVTHSRNLAVLRGGFFHARKQAGTLLIAREAYRAPTPAGAGERGMKHVR